MNKLSNNQVFTLLPQNNRGTIIILNDFETRIIGKGVNEQKVELTEKAGKLEIKLQETEQKYKTMFDIATKQIQKGFLNFDIVTG